MKKRIFSALMALCLAFSISGAAFAEPTPTPAPSSIATPTPTPSETPDSTPTPTAVQEGAEGDEPTAEPSATPSPEPSGSPEPSEVPDSETENTVTEEPGTSVPAGSEQQESDTTTEQPSASNGITDTAGLIDTYAYEPNSGSYSVAEENAKEKDSNYTLIWNRWRDNNDHGQGILNKAEVTVVLWDSEAQKEIYVNGNLDSFNYDFVNGKGQDNHLSFDQVTVPQIEGYEYQGVTYNGDTWENNSNRLQNLCIQYSTSWGRNEWGAYNASFEGRWNDRLENFLTTTGSGNDRNAEGTLHINYTPVETPTPTGDVTITDTLLTDGRLTATYTGNREGTVTYTWYRVTDDGRETQVTLDNGVNKLKNLGDNWVNVSLDVESLCYMLGDSTTELEQKNTIRSTHYTYKVVAKIGEEEVGSASLSIPYYAQLVNGSFETPDRSETFTKYKYNSIRDQWVTDGTSWENQNFSGQANVLLTVDDEDVVWKTTDKYQLIELIRTGSGSLSNHGVTQAPDGQQIAELNAESEGTLYQDVLTVPGSTLTWQLQHRGRNHGNSQTFSGYDTMFVVILPTNMVNDDIDQNDVRNIISAAGFNTETYYTNVTNGKGEQKTVENGKYAGAKVWRITDYVDENESSTRESWTEYRDTYTVPDGQYVTRFFFAAGATAFDCHDPNSGISHTVGNLLDDVWFSPELPPPADDEAQLIISKTVDGLSGDALADYEVNVTVTDEDGKAVVEDGITLTEFDADTHTATSAPITVTIPSGSNSVTLTVTETAPSVDGYSFVGSTYAVNDESSTAGYRVRLIAQAEQIYTVAFTNTYEPVYTPGTENPDPDINKYVDANEGGTYDLSLDVTGTAKKDENAGLNVLYILDETYSMMWDMDGSYPDDVDADGNELKDEQGYAYNHSGDNQYAFEDVDRASGNDYGPHTDRTIDYTTGEGGRGMYAYERYRTAVNAINTLNGVLLANDVDVEVAVVDFARSYISGSSEVTTNSQNWDTLDGSFSLNAPDYDQFASGTNYQAAFQAAITQLQQLPEDRKQYDTVVIFVTDGDPNRFDADDTNYDGTNYFDPEKEQLPTNSENVEDSVPIGIIYGQQQLANLVEALEDLENEKEGVSSSIYAIGISSDASAQNLNNLFYKKYNVKVAGRNDHGVAQKFTYTLENGTTVPSTMTSGVYCSDDAQVLYQTFAKIAADLTGVDMTNVVITDELSEYAELVGTTAIPQISIQRANGTTVDVTSPTAVATPDGNGVVTYQYYFSDKTNADAESATTQTLIYKYYPTGKYYNNEHPVITLEFPSTYALTDGWKYTITVPIQPTDEAYQYYAKNGRYPLVDGSETQQTQGDEGTDAVGNNTSSSQPGFYSNTEATLTYNEDGSKTYKKPVIQVKNGSLTINKRVSENVEDFVSGETYKFTITKLDGDGNKDETFEGTYTVTGATPTSVIFTNGVSGEITITGALNATVTGLPEGKYKVEESTGDMLDVGYNDEYYFVDESYAGNTGTNNVTEATDKNSATATVSAGQDTQVNVTNTYAEYRTVTVIKDVTGGMGETNRFFEFMAQTGTDAKTDVPQVNMTATTGPETAKVTANGKFELRDDGTTQGTVTIKKVRQDETLNIQEQLSDSQGYKTTYKVGDKSGSGTAATVTPDDLAKGNVTVTFTNERKVVAPTGLESNHTAPYALMVTAAGVAGLALLGSMAARRRRRQE